MPIIIYFTAINGAFQDFQHFCQISSYDRQKAATFREWSRLRNQVVQLKLLVLGTGED